MSNIADKVQKLLRTAERFAQDGNQEAADSYNAKAQALIIENAIDEASILNAGKVKDEPIVVQVFVPKGAKGYHDAWSRLFVKVAKALGLQAFTSMNGKVAKVVGYQSDIDTVDLLLASLTLQETHAMVTDWKRHKADLWYYDPTTDYATQKDFKRTHIVAFGETVAKRVAALRAEIVESKGTGTELVLVTKEARLAQFVKDNYRMRRYSMNLGSEAGATAGAVAGAKADIGQGRFNGSRKALV